MGEWAYIVRVHYGSRSLPPWSLFGFQCRRRCTREEMRARFTAGVVVLLALFFVVDHRRTRKHAHASLTNKRGREREKAREGEKGKQEESENRGVKRDHFRNMFVASVSVFT